MPNESTVVAKHRKFLKTRKQAKKAGVPYPKVRTTDQQTQEVPQLNQAALLGITGGLGSRAYSRKK